MLMLMLMLMLALTASSELKEDYFYLTPESNR